MKIAPLECRVFFNFPSYISSSQRSMDISPIAYFPLGNFFGLAQVNRGFDRREKKWETK